MSLATDCEIRVRIKGDPKSEEDWRWRASIHRGGSDKCTVRKEGRKPTAHRARQAACSHAANCIYRPDSMEKLWRSENPARPASNRLGGD